jgi:hypothetical protein
VGLKTSQGRIVLLVTLSEARSEFEIRVHTDMKDIDKPNSKKGLIEKFHDFDIPEG